MLARACEREGRFLWESLGSDTRSEKGNHFPSPSYLYLSKRERDSSSFPILSLSLLVTSLPPSVSERDSIGRRKCVRWLMHGPDASSPFVSGPFHHLTHIPSSPFPLFPFLPSTSLTSEKKEKEGKDRKAMARQSETENAWPRAGSIKRFLCAGKRKTREAWKGNGKKEKALPIIRLSYPRSTNILF